MDFDKGWGRIQRCLLIIAVIVSAWVIFDISLMMYRYYYDTQAYALTLQHQKQFEPLPTGLWMFYMWAVYFGARIIRWIVKGFIGKKQEEGEDD